MEQTLQALGGILLKAIPTIVLLLILHVYLKRMLFGPLERVLKQRDEATTGARHAAEESLTRAERRAAEYETAIRDARGEVYREQEAARNQMLADQHAQMKEARARVEALIQEAKTRIHAEAEAAKHSLADSSGLLADQISDAVLARRVS
jgi:F-type H+-transporting ATPase subunit b